SLVKAGSSAPQVNVAHARPVAGQGAAAAPAQAQAPGPGPGLNVGVLIRRALSHWPIAVFALVVGVAITFFVGRQRKLTFRSETTIFYREGIHRSLVGESGPDPLKQLGARLKEMLLSQSTLKLVIDECHLKQDEVKKRGYTDVIEGLRKKIDFKAKTSD